MKIWIFLGYTINRGVGPGGWGSESEGAGSSEGSAVVAHVNTILLGMILLAIIELGLGLAAVTGDTGQDIAAAYVARWRAPPAGIEGGRMVDAP